MTWIGRYVLPDGAPLQPELAFVSLFASDGTHRGARSQRAASLRIPGLPVVEHRIQIAARGLEHVEQVMDLSMHRGSAIQHATQHGSELEIEQELVLWPERWFEVIAVHIETPQGRAFSELGALFGLQSAQLLHGAFDVRARLAAPPELDAAGEAELASYHGPGSDGRWSYLEGSGGAVELHTAPPLWLGLWMYGEPLAWQLVGPAQREVTFHVGPEELAARLASLSLSVVEGELGRPASGAGIHLRARAPSRREGLDLVADIDGLLELEHLVPGTYALRITHGGTLYLDALVLGAGEVRDLGTIVLRRSSPIEVQVLHPDGSPARADLTLSAHRPGASIDELDPSSYRTRHGHAGRTSHLPAPAAPMILRATEAHHRRPPADHARSTIMLLDPARLPTGPLVLTLHEPARVHISLTGEQPGADARVEVLDALGLIVASAPLAGSRSGQLLLVPGSYRARLFEPGGGSREELHFEVDRERLEVLWP